MEQILVWILFAVGLVLIIKGGDYFVDAASWIAETLHIPKFIIGATIVSLATTLPELLVSLIAAAEGSVDMAVGNAVGSVTANIGLIFAILLAAAPPLITRKQLAPKGILMLAAAALLWVLSLNGSLTVLASLGLLVIFALFIWENIASGKKEMQDSAAEKVHNDKKTVIVNIVKFVLGAAGIVIGARLLVDNGTAIAVSLGVEQRIISLTMVAIGTSLPEFVTTITALVKKQGSLSVGNILGANIIDMTLILPLCAVISGGSLPISATSLSLDMPLCLGVGLLAVLPTLISGKFRRWQGIVMLVIYAAYIVLLAVNPAL